MYGAAVYSVESPIQGAKWSRSSANGGLKAKHTETWLVELKISFYSTFLWVNKELHCKYTSHMSLTSTLIPTQLGGALMHFLYGYQGNLWGTFKMKTWDDGSGLLKHATASRGRLLFRLEHLSGSPTTANHNSWATPAGKWRTARDQSVRWGRRVAARWGHKSNILRKLKGPLMRHWILNDNRVFMRGHLRRLMNNRGAAAWCTQPGRQVHSPGCG